MKNVVVAILVFFASLFVYTKLAGAIPFSVTSVTTTKTDTFTVNGEGKVSVPPDIATVSTGVTAQGATVKAVQETLNKNINAVSDAVKKAGVDSSDIKTTNYSINPLYDYRGTPQRITGYQAHSTLTIKVKNIENVNAVIDAATGAGATQVGGILFDVDDKTKAENEARKMAVDDAKKKAENAAKIAGFSLGRIINYSENFGTGPRPIQMLAKTAGAQEEMDATQVEPGSNEITVNVSLSFEIR